MYRPYLTRHLPERYGYIFTDCFNYNSLFNPCRVLNMGNIKSCCSYGSPTSSPSRNDSKTGKDNRGKRRTNGHFSGSIQGRGVRDEYAGDYR